MEHTELKKETSIDWLMTQLYKKGFIKETDGNEPIILMNQAKEIEKQQQGYSEEDIKFAYEQGARLAFISQSSLALHKGEFPNPDEWFEQFKNK